MITIDKWHKIVNNVNVGEALKKWYFDRASLHTYKLRSAKINLAKSSKITRAFIIVSKNFLKFVYSKFFLISSTISKTFCFKES